MPQSPLSKNPFTQPIPRGGRLDPTLGRGFMDDGQPTILTRRAMAVAAKIKKNLAAADKFADDNFGFMRVRLTREERIEAYENLSQQELEGIAGVYSPDEVKSMRQQYILDINSETGLLPEELNAPPR